MELVTHTLVSLTLARAGWNAELRRAAPIVIAGGLAADLDRASRVFGPRIYLLTRAGFTHSIVGSLLLAAGVAAIAWKLWRAAPKFPLSFAQAFLWSASGAVVHMLLDFCGGEPLPLLWPLRQGRMAADLLGPVDVWIFAILALGLLLPLLFGLVSEEIGARKEKRGPQRGAAVALVLVALYCVARWQLQDRALTILRAHTYHNAAPRAVGAFPTPVSPLLWRGVVETDNTLEEVEVSLKPGAYFDADRSSTYYKPEDSPALEAAQGTAIVRTFRQFCRFPIARVEKLEFGWRVELRDLRFPFSVSESRGFVAVVQMDNQYKVKQEELLNAYEASR